MQLVAVRNSRFGIDQLCFITGLLPSMTLMHCSDHQKAIGSFFINPSHAYVLLYTHMYLFQSEMRSHCPERRQQYNPNSPKTRTDRTCTHPQKDATVHLFGAKQRVHVCIWNAELRFVITFAAPLLRPSICPSMARWQSRVVGSLLLFQRRG